MNLSANVENRRRAYAISFVIAVLLILGGFIIGMLTPAIFPDQASAQSILIDNLFRFMLVIGGTIFLLVQGVLAYSVVRFRVRAGDTTDGPPIHGNAMLEFVWTAVPALIVLVLAYYSFSVWQQMTRPEQGEFTVQGVGQRFLWSFTYYDAENDVTFNSSELHTYVGQHLKLELETQDVNHAFWVPAFRLKQDLLTGRTTEVRFQPIEVPGTEYPVRYPIRCAELCGDGHGDMDADVIVYENEEAYREWFDQRVFEVLNPPEDPVLRGEQLLRDAVYPCAGCHTLNTLGWAGITGPNLNGIGTRAERRVAGLEAEDYIHQSIREPQAFLVPGYGPLMPAFTEEQMPEDDLQAIIAYLLTQTE